MKRKTAVFVLLLFLVGIVAASADVCEEWFTSNEEAVPGDWDGTKVAGASDEVLRSGDVAHSGAYSYKHQLGGGPNCTAATYVECDEYLISGEMEGWLYPADQSWPPGHLGGTPEVIFALGNWYPFGSTFSSGQWELSYTNFEDRVIIQCQNCIDQSWHGMGLIEPETWYHFRVVWDLPPSPATGTLQAWMDDYLYVDLHDLEMEVGGGLNPYLYSDTLLAGWYDQTIWNTDQAWYIDDVWINPPSATPTPAPTTTACDQYGHSAVVNVDNDCNGIIRFEFPADMPRDAEIDQAMLNLYVVALEPYAQTLYWTYLVPLWGEMTTDWCRRTVGDLWTEPGASNIPGDRAPGVYGTFRVSDEGEWVQIPMDPEVIEAWNADREADPGIIIFNETASGKVSFASREWYDATADYRPRLDLWYSD